MSLKILKTANKTLSVFRNITKCLSVSVRKKNAWTQEGIVKSPYSDVDIPNTTLNEYIWQNLEKWPQRTMSVCAQTGRGYTYEQAFNLSNAFAANLRKKFKIRDGDVVTVMLPNIPDYPLITLGILEAGGVISTINPIYTAHEIQRQVLMSGSKVIVTMPEILSVVKKALEIAKLNIPIIVVKTNGDMTPEGTVAFNELSEDIHVDKSCLKEVRRTASDLCFLPYSSGTTGLPKGVELTTRNIVANCQQINEPLIKSHNDTTATHQDVVLAILPFFHIYAAVVIMFHKMAQGIKIVTLSKLKPEHYLESLEKFKVNTLFVAPPLVILMANHPMASHKTYQYLETVVSGAAPIASSDVERFVSKVQQKFRFSQGYGLTETSPVVSMSEHTCEDYNSVGYPVPNTEIRVVDDSMNNLGPNQMGELLVRGPQVMRGYRNDPESTASSLTSDGWFKTGDLAIIDASGTYRICDRKKELIKVKGFQVPPAELEAVLREHPAISDAAVIGVPHATKGESPKAFVSLKPGQNIRPNDICNFVADKVASYKRIDDVVILGSIPRSAAGKILRKELKSEYC